MNDKIAIDIALLPPDEIMDLAIKLNHDYGPELLLNKTDRLPHLTLSQAIVNKSDLDKVKKIVKHIASRSQPIKVKAKIIPNLIEPYENDSLFKLHRAVMAGCADLVSYDAKESHFYDDRIREKSLNWVRNFNVDSAHDKFYPHITLITTRPIVEQPDVSFTMKRIAICHLGDYNTCCQILYETRLGK